MKKKNFAFLSYFAIPLPMFLISCSTTKNENVNQDMNIENLDIEINNELFVNEENTARAFVNNIIQSQLYYEWIFDNENIQIISGQGSPNLKFKSTIEINQAKLTLKVYLNSSKDKELKSIEKSISIIAKPTNVTYSVSISSSSSTHKVNQKSEFIANLKASDNSSIPEKFYYDWSINEGEILDTNGNSNTSITFKTTGSKILNLNVYEDDTKFKKIASTSLNINVTNETSESLVFPSDEDLLITGKILKYCGYVIDTKLSESETKQKLNEYGVVNTFSLITKIYSNSEGLFNNDLFDSINIEFLENQNYDLLKFRITGIVKKSATGWGKFPFSGIIENWQGTNINVGDNVEVIFQYNRSSSSNSKGQNLFDLSNVHLSGIVLSDSNKLKWFGLEGTPTLDLPYLTDFLGSCSIKINNNVIKNTNNDNRVLFAFIYNFKNEYSQNGNKDIYMLCDRKSFK